MIAITMIINDNEIDDDNDIDGEYTSSSYSPACFSECALKSEEEVGPSNVTTIIKKARIFVPLDMIDQWIPLHSALSKLYIDVVEIICYFCLVCFFVVWSYNTSKAGKSSILMMYTASPLPQLCKCQHSFSLELWMNDKLFRFMSYTSFVLLLVSFQNRRILLPPLIDVFLLSLL